MPELLTRENVEQALTAAVPGRMPQQLVDYWTRGEGAAKIRWGTDGSFDRCVRALRRYFPKDPKGLCARLHKRATGEWPAEKGVQSAVEDVVTAHAGTETQAEIDAYAVELDADDPYAASLVPMKTVWRTKTPIAPYGVLTGDRRRFSAGGLTNRDLPLPFMWQEANEAEHGKAVVVGRILGLDHRDDGTYAHGDFLNEETFPDVTKAKELMRNKVIGPSVDLDDVTYEYRNEDGTAFDDEAYMEAVAKGQQPARPVFEVTAGRISGATLVNIPAFANLQIEMEEVPDEDGVLAALDAELAECEDCLEAAALAASGYVGPPLSAFSQAELDGPTPLTITDDGRVFGHLATWSTCHVGFPGACVTPPSSPTKYAYFHTGEVQCDDGTRVPVGRLMIGAKHANLSLGFKASAQHYDDTGRVAALVRAYEDDHGIALFGVLVGDLDDQTRAQFAALPLSGDWRRVGGNLELVAAISVPVPGFPVARVTQPELFREPEQAALVAAGMFHSPRAQAVDEPAQVVHVDLPAGQTFNGSGGVSMTADDDGNVTFTWTVAKGSEQFAQLVQPSTAPDNARALGPNATEALTTEFDAALAEVFGMMDEERQRLLAQIGLGG